MKQLAVVVKVGTSYKIIFDKKRSKLLSETTFLEQFTGIMVAIEEGKDTVYLKTRSLNGLKILAIVTLAIYIFIFLSLKPVLIVSIHFLLSLVGIAASILILQHDLGISSKIIDKICSQESKISNCNTILNSEGAKLFNSIKLSDFSFIYFVSINIAWFLLILNNTPYSIIYGISLLSILVVFYSIFYQIFIAKTWCLLCLSVAAILTIQALLPVFPTLPDINFSHINLNSVLIVALSFSGISAIWFFTSSKIKKEKKYDLLKIEATRFKRNYYIFKNLLQEAEPINTEILNTSEIVIGREKAPIKFLVITNPFCGFCKEMHHLVELLLLKHSDKINITIRFNININNLENDLGKVCAHLLNIFHKSGQQASLQAMHDIYNKMDTKLWFQQYANNIDTLYYQDILLKEKEWCAKNNINFTPKLLINGFTYPKEYKKEDILYFMEDLYETYSNSTTNILTTV